MLQRYSIQESLSRIWRALSGKPIETDEPEIYNDFPWNVTLSNMAELFQNSYPDVTGTIPQYFQISSGSFSHAHNLMHLNSYVNSDVVLSAYDAEPARAAVSDIHGGIDSLATAQPLSSGTPVTFSKGIGKFIVVVNAGTDLNGTIMVSGTSINRNTGVATPSDTNLLLIDGVSTDDSDTDSNGNDRYSFGNTYITSNWFHGEVSLFTNDLDISDLDVYHISFEQFNDKPDLVLETFDINMLVTNAAAELDAYLYLVDVTGGIANISRVADLHVGADGFTAISNTYNRLRRGNLETPLDGNRDGIWINVFYSNSPAYVEDVTIKVWAREKISLNL